jgi:hypothetical protein
MMNILFQPKYIRYFSLSFPKTYNLSPTLLYQHHFVYKRDWKGHFNLLTWRVSNSECGILILHTQRKSVELTAVITVVRALVYTVMSLRFPQEARDLLSALSTVNFLRKTPLHGVGPCSDFFPPGWDRILNEKAGLHKWKVNLIS